MSYLSVFITFSLGWIFYDWLKGDLDIESFKSIWAVAIALTLHWASNHD